MCSKGGCQFVVNVIEAIIQQVTFAAPYSRLGGPLRETRTQLFVGNVLLFFFFRFLASLMYIYLVSYFNFCICIFLIFISPIKSGDFSFRAVHKVADLDSLCPPVFMDFILTARATLLRLRTTKDKLSTVVLYQDRLQSVSF